MFNLTIKGSIQGNGDSYFLPSLQSAIFRNITFVDLNITTNGGSLSCLISGAYDSFIQNVKFITSSPDLFNNFYVGNPSYLYSMGSVVGYASNVSMTDITIQNTVVRIENNTNQSPGPIGGMVGELVRSSMTRCYNLGFPLNSTQVIVSSLVNSGVGGLVGKSEQSNITSCGVENGVISGSSNLGGLVGYFLDSKAEESYIKSSSVQGNSSNVASLFGYIDNSQFGSQIINVYSRADVAGDIGVVNITFIDINPF